MAGNEHARAALNRFAPRSHTALQNFVMSMAAVVNNSGKRSFFGRDKGVAAMEKFGRSLESLLVAMALDGQISDGFSAEDVAHKVDDLIKLFRDGYPNWQDAYLYYEWLSTDNRQKFIQAIDAAA
ncbi:hypothetical protein RCH27_08405 [Paracidovorax citrulli]|uniref:hypothetical protein n=1 Tax=Paracidovorax citrulli TaxID=80869 RepID=UPI003A811F94